MQARVFVKTCLQAKKSVFGNGALFNLLVYYCNTGMRNYSVVNGKEKGSPVDLLQYYTADMCRSLKEHHVFLDSVSGDALSYDPFLDMWHPIANFGLHSKQSMQRFLIEERKGLPSAVRTERGTAGTRNKAAMYGKSVGAPKAGEAVVSVLREQAHHRLLSGVQRSFTVERKALFETHEQAPGVPHLFKVLGESQDGVPVLVQLDRCLALHFEVDRKTPDSVRLFENFVA